MYFKLSTVQSYMKNLVPDQVLHDYQILTQRQIYDLQRKKETNGLAYLLKGGPLKSKKFNRDA